MLGEKEKKKKRRRNGDADDRRAERRWLIVWCGWTNGRRPQSQVSVRHWGRRQVDTRGTLCSPPFLLLSVEGRAFVDGQSKRTDKRLVSIWKEADEGNENEGRRWHGHIPLTMTIATNKRRRMQPTASCAFLRPFSPSRSVQCKGIAAAAAAVAAGATHESQGRISRTFPLFAINRCLSFSIGDRYRWIFPYTGIVYHPLHLAPCTFFFFSLFLPSLQSTSVYFPIQKDRFPL